MKRGDVHSCPSCNTLHTVTLIESSLIVCKSCGTYIHEATGDENTPEQSKMPDDWTFLKIGSTCELPQQTFHLVGRCRLQLRNDYKNFWCAEYGRGKCLWIAESFGSFSIFLSAWEKFAGDPAQLRAGASVKMSNELKLIGEYVEKCEGISFAGEIGAWNFFTPGFFVVQASATTKTSFFFLEPKKNVSFLSGEKILAERLNFKNTIEWNEWK
ncbi:hypothetical protein [Chryseolinea lacunae]|uniref:DUF4178 domain-containing protein n=1 Tax=Chryseolinea lacunae TaxID=2801331 RepID=A0ABS1KRG1_9BACT|nr:hypothetical protein [Chryseolinea lacunae]MBL0742029.1 hypothetical protein [Chryseolinea lacunae]